ncbi:hypothetical protein GRF29_19g76462 [Pseudopithomyces chartarum]|uniref:Uncharacterized protein n=1 Tax=Pseudopithomyces chartarum TaxID=1892770 RepID=A0AAN6RL85_9PLEO|nr:hypothetical protein GRF29_19g76462 [Pseudopithomyces chartarum]
MTTESSFHLFTSLRYDPALELSEENSSPTLNFYAPSPFYMLIYHRDRMLEAAQHFDFSAVADRLQDGPRLHQDLLNEVHRYQEQNPKNVPLKLRILFSPTATLTIDFAPVPPVSLSTLYPPSFSPQTPLQPLTSILPPSQAAPSPSAPQTPSPPPHPPPPSASTPTPHPRPPSPSSKPPSAPTTTPLARGPSLPTPWAPPTPKSSFGTR